MLTELWASLLVHLLAKLLVRLLEWSSSHCPLQSLGGTENTLEVRVRFDSHLVLAMFKVLQALFHVSFTVSCGTSRVTSRVRIGSSYFEYVHTVPATQVVGPVQPMPPPERQCVNNALLLAKMRPTLSPLSTLGVGEVKVAQDGGQSRQRSDVQHLARRSRKSNAEK